MFDFTEQPHRRFNPLLDEWVLVSPHRAKRPWQGQQEENQADNRPEYDPTCYLCPGNTRTSGDVNPQYPHQFVFDNDFAALLPEGETGTYEEGGLLRAEAETGHCRVICFSPKHNLTLPEMEVSEIRRVVDTWTDEFRTLGADPNINYVQIFENKGFVMGCSNPHPHGQIWSERTVPDLPAKEARAQKAYFEQHGRTLLADYLAIEEKTKTRFVVENDTWVVLVPFWAVWPFETLVLPRRAVQDLTQLNDQERDGLADILSQLTIKYDNLFEVSFPYSAGFHQRPTDGGEHPEWHLHMHFLPPLLRSATVKKFMVGYELLANAQRDITPEQAAERLRALPAVHYKAAAAK
ncbi:MAG TPA: UDP-glucose--hexose-1-phosphate uridylyltransferase [Hymenobacter sp.]|uniref:UDP-glucose--hexose-1-phosphate uridylyltransferase n=1 Tax=Hymenobacter sp. TaxID=1898978 RepID=UPI002D7F5494|nr:UDP-glucose--hexose-1-phosphate uridylyltransferase [Hymenobacter sp.]HET9505095.1 UDP-glucose--hexose-1-phosphate uridylyltransferase [Hymenobacter sp.]